jgi:nitrogen fixation NifU-like protein
MTNDNQELYQQVILDHNKKPRNFAKLDPATHTAEGYNPLCGDHLNVYLRLSPQHTIDEITFSGDGCAISKASASMMTTNLKGKSIDETNKMFEQFRELINGKLNPQKDPNILGRLAIFSNIWHYPARVKCASLCWHTMKAALDKEPKAVSTE